jgi:hypothetical protein
MIRKIFLFAFFSISVSQLSAQSVMQSFGATISVLYGKITTPYSSESFALSQTNFTYFPRLNFVENDNSSISIGAPVGVGIGIVRSTGYSDVGISFAYDLPVVLDYNIGCKSTPDNENNFGGYVGAGFGYYRVNVSKSENSDFTGISYGPIFRGGVRIGSSQDSWKGHALTIGMYYKKGLEKDKFKTIGFNVLYDL